MTLLLYPQVIDELKKNLSSIGVEYTQKTLLIQNDIVEGLSESTFVSLKSVKTFH